MNLFTTLDGKANLLNPFLERVTCKLTIISNSKQQLEDNFIESHAYLTFFRGVFLKHLNRTDEALNCFVEVISLYVNNLISNCVCIISNHSELFRLFQ